MPDADSTVNGRERRRYARIPTSNLVSYVCVDEEGNDVGQGMGTALDVSLGGVLLETYLPVEAPYLMVTSMDPEEQLIDVRAKVVHSRAGDPGKFLTGLRFVDAPEKLRDVIVRIVKAYHKQIR